jgi:hypothetical protein
MNAPTITDPVQLYAIYLRVEQLLGEAAKAGCVAFVRWQQAYGAYELACDDALTARASRAQALVP